MVCEAFKEAGLQCYSKNFGFKQLYTILKSVITKAQESLKLKIKSVCVAMFSLVMSLSLCDFLRHQQVLSTMVINLQ